MGSEAPELLAIKDANLRMQRELFRLAAERDVAVDRYQLAEDRIDELTTLLYEPLKGTCLTHTPCVIAACGACRKKADKPESVVHDSDCPVYRLQRAEAANTAVIRANAEEIADLLGWTEPKTRNLLYRSRVSRASAHLVRAREVPGLLRRRALGDQRLFCQRAFAEPGLGDDTGPVGRLGGGGAVGIHAERRRDVGDGGHEGEARKPPGARGSRNGAVPATDW